MAFLRYISIVHIDLWANWDMGLLRRFSHALVWGFAASTGIVTYIIQKWYGQR